MEIMSMQKKVSYFRDSRCLTIFNNSNNYETIIKSETVSLGHFKLWNTLHSKHPKKNLFYPLFVKKGYIIIHIKIGTWAEFS